MKPVAFNWQAGTTDDPSPQTDFTPPLRRKQVPAVAFSCKDSGADASEELAPTLRSMSHSDSHANGGGQVAVAVDVYNHSIDGDCAATLNAASGVPNHSGPKVMVSAMNLLGREGGAMPELDELASLRAASGGSSRSYICGGDDYAGAYEADASSVLSTLRKCLGKKAVAEWGSRILDSLQSPEILQSWLHGTSLRCASGDFKSFVDDRPLPRQEGSAAATLRKVWQEGPDGCSPQGRGLAKQLAHQLGKALPQLPHANPPQPVMQVRRLTPVECEKLQGFPPNYTLVPHRGKPAADGPRYKALGNSMAVPCMAWIGQRIAMVEKICGSRKADMRPAAVAAP